MSIILQAAIQQYITMICRFNVKKSSPRFLTVRLLGPFCNLQAELRAAKRPWYLSSKKLKSGQASKQAISQYNIYQTNWICVHLVVKNPCHLFKCFFNTITDLCILYSCPNWWYLQSYIHIIDKDVNSGLQCFIFVVASLHSWINAKCISLSQ